MLLCPAVLLQASMLTYLSSYLAMASAFYYVIFEGVMSIIDPKFHDYFIPHSFDVSTCAGFGQRKPSPAYCHGGDLAGCTSPCSCNPGAANSMAVILNMCIGSLHELHWPRRTVWHTRYSQHVSMPVYCCRSC